MTLFRKDWKKYTGSKNKSKWNINKWVYLFIHLLEKQFQIAIQIYMQSILKGYK